MAKNQPVYLFTGPEFGERTESVESVKSSFIKKFSAVDEHHIYLLETSFSEVMAILQSGTLFSDAVLVICHNAELIKKKDDIKMLSDWLENAESTSLLILLSDDVMMDAKLEKIIPPSNRKKFWELSEDKLFPWLQNYFRKNGYSITPEAAQLMLDMTETNTQALKTEAERFFVCFQKEHKITEEDVESILTHNREENVFSLFAAIANPSMDSAARFEKGITILQKIRLSKENSSIMIIAGLASCFRTLMKWHDIGESAVRGITLQKQYRGASRIWSKGQTAAVLAVLASTDMEIRSGRSPVEDILLQKMLYEVIMKKGGKIQAINPEN
ncbi:MAG: DNA polymerase III subunit delta [Treponema sp.]|nr:DNA polymerase III subunit delta [Treponema sp.]